MSKSIVEELHKMLVKPTNSTDYPSKTLDYTPELYSDICDSFLDHHQIGWTVCGAQDPAVIHLGEAFAKQHPELAEYAVVRVIDKYLNAWNSATLLEFSNKDITDEEYALYEEIMQEQE